MKTAGRENPNRWARAPRNRAHGAAGQYRSRSITWAAKQEKFQPQEMCFFLTSTLIERFSKRYCPRPCCSESTTYGRMAAPCSGTIALFGNNCSPVVPNHFPLVPNIPTFPHIKYLWNLTRSQLTHFLTLTCSHRPLFVCFVSVTASLFAFNRPHLHSIVQQMFSRSRSCDASG